MKTSKAIWPFACTALFAAAFLFSPSLSVAQNKDQAQTVAQFPEPVSGIFKNSCVGCHNDNGRGKAKELLNLSSWDKLSHKQKAKTAKLINKVIANESMPPADMVKRRPELALNAEQKSQVTTWAKEVKKK